MKTYTKKQDGMVYETVDMLVDLEGLVAKRLWLEAQIAEHQSEIALISERIRDIKEQTGVDAEE